MAFVDISFNSDRRCCFQGAHPNGMGYACTVEAQEEQYIMHLPELFDEFSPRSASSCISTAPSTPECKKEFYPDANQSKPKKNKKMNRAKQAPEEDAVNIFSPHSAMASRGSKNHAIGQCRPCRDFFTAAGCKAGALCNFCHHPHDQDKHIEAKIYSTKASQRRAATAPSPEKPGGDQTEMVNHYSSCFEPRTFERAPGIGEDPDPWYVPIPVSFLSPPGL